MPLSGLAAPTSGQQSDFATAFAVTPIATQAPSFVKTTTGIADSVPASVCTLAIPNADCSCSFRVLVRSAITAAGHNYDSSRVSEYLGIITRRAGLAAVVSLSGVLATAIATLAAGETLTSVLSAAAPVGAAGAAQTIDLQITNALSVAGTSETTVSISLLNSATNPVTVS